MRRPGWPTSKPRWPRGTPSAAGLFATTSFWRDLIAFTWNLKTVENHDGVADLLQNTMDTTDASNFRVTEGEEPTEAGGVVTASFTFETPWAAVRACCG